MSIWDDFDSASGMTPSVDAKKGRVAALRLAEAALRAGEGKGAVRMIVGALGLTQPLAVEVVDPQLVPQRSGWGKPLSACPSDTSMRRHARRGENCVICWPGGRGTVATQRESA